MGDSDPEFQMIFFPCFSLSFLKLRPVTWVLMCEWNVLHKQLSGQEFCKCNYAKSHTLHKEFDYHSRAEWMSCCIKYYFGQVGHQIAHVLPVCWSHAVLTLPSPFLPPAGMRILVTLLLDTLPMLGNVLLLCFFVFFIFGIVGVQLWVGRLRNRCFVEDSFPL